ncbi:MAG: hypothetical protein FWB94_09095 [Chitinispirillia bacterium]|nr:hypothetical protein [Chitinispirillia bacterium]
MSNVMNADKAYLLGLVIGGGVFGNAEDTFVVKLPYKKWGSCIREPERAGEIAKDILKVVGPMFRAVYGLNISYQASQGGIWNVLCEGDLAVLINDLNYYGISPVGEIRRNVSVEKIVTELVDDYLKRRFVAGLGDTIGSLTPSHRRFTADNQIISFEIPGMCFNFVCQLCRLLYSLKCYPDQVLWNHPNFHAGSDPYYKPWKKGFKVRVKLDQYAKFGAFAFKTKVESSVENLELQETPPGYVEPCESHRISAEYSCVHLDENSPLLPPEIRGGHYIHHKHVCAVLGCEHTPYDEIKRLLKYSKERISPFPIIVKGDVKYIESIINKTPLFKNRMYCTQKLKVKKLYKMYTGNARALIFGNAETTGYPLSEIMQGVAYLISAQTGNLHGKRPKGNFIEIIETALLSMPTMSFGFKIPDLLTPLMIFDESYAVLIGARNPSVYKKLIHIDEKIPYKIIVNNIKEEDLR